MDLTDLSEGRTAVRTFLVKGQGLPAPLSIDLRAFEYGDFIYYRRRDAGMIWGRTQSWLVALESARP